MDNLARVADILKAADQQRQRGEGERPEAFAAPVEARLARSGGAIARDVAADLARLVGVPDPGYATPGARVTPEQIGYLKDLVRQHYLSHLAPDARAAFWNVPEATKARWRALGILGPSGQHLPLAAIDDMVVAARVAELLEHNTSYARMVQLAQDRPFSRVEELAMEVARTHAGYAIARLADRHGDAAQDLGFRATQAEFGGLLADYLAGRLKRGDATIATPGGLASALRQKFTVEGGDIERDWLRVAVSETRFAFNYGTFVHYLEQGYARVYYVVQPDACPHCKKLLLLPDGVTPRIFALDDIVADLAANGGLNVGRSAAKIGQPGGWLPTALIHPWCRCRPQPYLPGLPPIPTGDLRRG